MDQIVAKIWVADNDPSERTESQGSKETKQGTDLLKKQKNNVTARVSSTPTTTSGERPGDADRNG